MPEDQRESTSNQVNGDIDGSFVQAGMIGGDVNINSGGDTGFDVIISRDLEFQLDPGQPSTFGVNLVNRYRRQSVEVELHIAQLRPEIVTIEPPGPITLPPDVVERRQIRLMAMPTIPEAGTYAVRVVATEIGGKHRNWQSDDAIVFVPENPSLKLTLSEIDTGVPAKRRAVLNVHNTGNVHIDGELVPTNLLAVEGVEFDVDKGSGISLAAGAEDERTIVVLLPQSAPLRRTSCLGIGVDRQRPAVDVPEAKMEFTQEGWLRDIVRIVWVNALLPRLPRRVAVSVWAILGIVLGLLAGTRLGPTIQDPVVAVSRPVVTASRHVSQTPTPLPNLLAGQFPCSEDYFRIEALWPPPDYFRSGHVDPSFRDPYRAALRFTQDYLGFSVVNLALGEQPFDTRRLDDGLVVAVGYQPSPHDVVIVADVHVICSENGTWAVSGTRDNSLALVEPVHNMILRGPNRNPLTIGGTLATSGVAGRIVADVFDPGSTTPISANCSAPDAKSWSVTCSYHDTGDSPLIVMVSVHDASGKLLKFALTCFRHTQS
ncbi:MAG TPA: hypothetical protein VFX16_30415 [Pseudonocardiaceae bacterium]|nr:hypothetical protein [Pseudonocardiaceae bacterium]